jgi:hypothetical protein
MNRPSTPAIPPEPRGPWRILVLDRDPADPKWCFATISIASDVRPAVLDDAGRYTDWGDVTLWVNAMFPGAVSLAPMPGAAAWRIYEGGPR